MSAVPVLTPAEELTVVPKRHPGRWLAAAVILIIVVRMAISVLGNERFGWDTVNTYLRDVSIGSGLMMTLGLTVACMVVGVILGALLAVVYAVASLAQLVVGKLAFYFAIRRSMKACFCALGVVAHPRNSFGYCSGSRLARNTNPALSLWLANYEADL